jgi:gamma-glutamyl-gamma-aminobutyrate hydrolase PuuD
MRADRTPTSGSRAGTVAPIVGVTTYRQRAAWGPWDRTAAVLATSYVECVTSAGAQPVLLPPSNSNDPRTGAASVVDAIDALVLVGGGDIDPVRYSQPAHCATNGIDPMRDEAESFLLDAALATGVPVLAICRGMQLLNVHRGGTLVQHLPDAVGHTGHQPRIGCFAPVAVTTVPGSRIARILGTTATVRCSHHQAVDQLGEGLVVTARAGDGVAEAIEIPAARFAVGVQWHPEEESDTRLFEALVNAAAR